MAEAAPEVLVSVHDVMPDTLDRVAGILAALEAAGAGSASLLVVPGVGWTGETLDRLHGLLARGHTLAGHGWLHRCLRIRGLRHRLHSALISRDVAEHLCLDAADIEALIRRCGEWFPRHGLPQPDTYVPPAWAMGRIERWRLHGLGFRYFETLTGSYDAGTGRFRPLPLAGFEADTRFRALVLRALNRTAVALAAAGRPLRLAIHPHDPELLLARDLERLIATAAGSTRRVTARAGAG
ncbi:polysaccharide deacetylase family protein [Lentisalinibacter sediminis]|uniref:polysaccharide deacetylase family protein n=1 Tax=Lentisalinibacter sediminis TaxID=2992237 RepID=UPI00386725D3